MTITGVNATVAMSVLAASATSSFSSPEKLVSYFGLNPRDRQSGDKPAYHGRITKQGRATRDRCSSKRRGSSLVRQARYAHSSSGSGTNGQTCRCGGNARKLAVIIWHILTKDEDYTWNARHSCNGSSENSSSKPVIRLAAAVARKDPPPPTATSQCGQRARDGRQCRG